LVKNTGIGEGEIIYLWGNPLSEISKKDYIRQLESRHVCLDDDLWVEIRQLCMEEGKYSYK